MDTRSPLEAAPLTLTLIGGPTVLLGLAGLRLLTDPTFDPPGEYPVGQRVLTKTTPPARAAAQIGAVDAVLLSHDQHPDNLDHAGRRYLEGAPLVLTTPSGADRLGGRAQGLAPWASVELAGPGGTLQVTAVPALHGPPGSEHLTGEVTGFVLTGDRTPTVYVSGDNASLDAVDLVATAYRSIDVAILFAGGARTPLLGEHYLTLSSAMAAGAARRLRARRVVVVHAEGWSHFTETTPTVAPAFAAAGLAEVLVPTPPGVTVTL